jgi:group I intron endonuclease
MYLPPLLGYHLWMAWTIYCHTHIETGRRYIGQTKNDMSRRWRDHVRSAKSPAAGWFFAAAIRKYGAEAFSHRVLEVCGTLEEANDAEAAWIDSFSTRHPEFGFNLRPGGRLKTIPQSKASTRSKISDAARKHWADPEFVAKWRAARSTPEFQAKQSAALTGKTHGPETRAKQSAVKIGKKHTPEARAKMSESQRKRPPVSDETRAKISARQAGRDNLSPESRAAANKALVQNKFDHTGAKRSDESRAKMAAAHLGVKRGPHSEEHRARIGAALRARSAKNEGQIGG